MSAMGKKELANCLVECNKYDSVAEATRAIDNVVNCLSMNLEKGSDITLVGFGKFSVKDRPAREGRNPSTGATMQIAASKAVTFKVGKALKDSVNK